MNRKYYLNQIEEYRRRIKEIGLQLEDERRNSNSEEASIRTELLNKQRHFQKRINNVKDLLRGNIDTEKGCIGNAYTIQSRIGRKKLVLVPPEEANPTKGFISSQSPLGKMLVGRNKNDIISIRTPIGTVEYKVVSVSTK